MKFKKHSRRGRKFRTTRRSTQFKIYNFEILTDLINYSEPTYTQSNLDFDLTNLLQGNEVFQKLAEMYQQYKIKSINFRAIPRHVNGTEPKPCFIFLDTRNYLNFNYSALSRLQGAKILTGKKLQTYNFRSSGRQDDFGYWFDPLEGPSASIRLHSTSSPTSSVFWQFQLKYYISMRGLNLKYENEKLEANNCDKVIIERLGKDTVCLTNNLEQLPSKPKNVCCGPGEVIGESALSVPPREIKTNYDKVYQKFKKIPMRDIPSNFVEKDEESVVYENEMGDLISCKAYYNNVKQFGEEQAKQFLNGTKEMLANEIDYLDDEEDLKEEILERPPPGKPKTRRKENHKQEEKEEKIPWDLKENPILNALKDEKPKEVNKSGIDFKVKLGSKKKKKKRK